MFMPCGCWGRGYLFLVLDCKGGWDNMPLPQTAHTWTPDPILASALHICSRRYCHMSPCLLQVNIWRGNFRHKSIPGNQGLEGDMGQLCGGSSGQARLSGDGGLYFTVQTSGLALDQGRSHTEPMGPGAFSSLEFTWSRLLNFLNILSSVPSGRMKCALGSF